MALLSPFWLLSIAMAYLLNVELELLIGQYTSNRTM